MAGSEEPHRSDPDRECNVIETGKGKTENKSIDERRTERSMKAFKRKEDSRRMQIMHQIIEERINSGDKESVDELLSIYTDIANIDTADEKESQKVARLIQQAIYVNGGASFHKRDEDDGTYMVTFYRRSGGNKYQVLSVEILIGAKSAKIVGYEIFD